MILVRLARHEEVVQPPAACRLQEPLSRTEWLAGSVCFVGTIMLSCTLEPTDWATVQLSWMLSKMLASMVLMLVALPALELVSRKAKQAQAAE